MSTLATRARRFYVEHRKAFAASAGAGLTALVGALADGHVTGAEGWAILSAVLVPFGVTFVAPANKRRRPQPHD